MRYGEFERRAVDVWEEIPEEYRAGVDGLVIERPALPHPTLPDIYTLGECRTESYPSDWEGPDTVRSILVLFYGSFRRLSELDPDFDWDAEIWETVTHELRHHLESLAAEDALEDVDYAVDENFKRLDGRPFDPFFFRAGEPVAPGVFDAEGDIFIELPLPETAGPETGLTFPWGGRTFRVPMPERVGDVTFIEIEDGLGVEAGAVCLVLVRRQGLLTTLRRWLARSRPDVVQDAAIARPVAAPDGPGSPPSGAA